MALRYRTSVRRTGLAVSVASALGLLGWASAGWRARRGRAAGAGGTET
jgi:hypothetical protein